MKTLLRRIRSSGINLTFVAFLVMVVLLFPLIWMTLSSFKPNPELFTRPPTILPRTWTMEHYVELFWFTSFPRYFLNTFLVGAVAVLIGVAVSLCGVYSISRFKFIGAKQFTFIMLFIYMLPPVLLSIPFFQIWYSLGMLNTLTSLIFTYLTITVPFAIWVLRPYIESIPRELEEAARVDGCTQFQAFYRVIVPQSLPGIVASMIFTFVVVWNEYLYALILITDENLRTVSLGIGSLILETSVYSWGLVNAAGAMATIPILLVFSLVQRVMVTGLTAGAVKG